MLFEDALRENLEADKNLSRRGRRILMILNEGPSRRRSRKIARMERTAKEALGVKGAVDWAEVDWPSVLKMLLELLLKLLPFLI